MEQYKEKLKLTQRIITIAALILMIFSIISLMSEAGIMHITPQTGDSHWHSSWRGIICGASCGIAVLMLVCILRISKALRSEKELKKLYVEATDERMNQIYTAARASAMQIFLIGGLVAGIIAGYFSMTVSITILACVTIHALIGGIFKLYYSNKL